MQEMSCLSVTESQQLVCQIDQHRDKWLSIRFKEVDEKLPFYSLGVSVTYVATQRYNDQKKSYREWAKEENIWLEQEFGWFYQRIVETLEQHLQAPVRFDSELSLPGFHVFLYHALFTRPLGIIHCDRQHLDLGFTDAQADLNKPISFTVALELPVQGSGIDFWDVHLQDIKTVSYEEFGNRVKQAKHSYHPYHVGNMVIHSGYHAHRIAPVTGMQENDRRITLQGHGVKRRNGEWVIYW